MVYSPRGGAPPTSWNASVGEFDYGGAAMIGPLLAIYSVEAPRVLKRSGLLAPPCSRRPLLPAPAPRLLARSSPAPLAGERARDAAAGRAAARHRSVPAARCGRGAQAGTEARRGAGEGAGARAQAEVALDGGEARRGAGGKAMKAEA